MRALLEIHKTFSYNLYLYINYAHVFSQNIRSFFKKFHFRKYKKNFFWETLINFFKGNFILRLVFKSAAASRLYNYSVRTVVDLENKLVKHIGTIRQFMGPAMKMINAYYIQSNILIIIMILSKPNYRIRSLCLIRLHIPTVLQQSMRFWILQLIY